MAWNAWTDSTRGSSPRWSNAGEEGQWGWGSSKGKGGSWTTHGQASSSPRDKLWDAACAKGTIGGTLGGKALPIEERCLLIKDLVVGWANHYDIVDLKFSIIRMLSWPVESVDSSMYLLTELPRKTKICVLGECRADVVVKLTEQVTSRPRESIEEVG